MLSFLRRDPKKQLQKVLGDYDLPSFPSVAHEALRQVRSGEASPTDVGRTLAQDPALSLAVLKTVNSAAYSIPRKVESVAQAAGLLGLASVESIVLSIAVAKAVPAKAAPGFEPSDFWLLASWRAATARALAKELQPSRADQSYTCGLLQDMAIPVLIDRVGEPYVNLLAASNDSGDDLAALEREQFGWDHAEVASWLCSEWEIPEMISACIAGHHGAEIEGCEIPPEITMVCLLRRPQDDDGVERMVDAAISQFGMDGEHVREIAAESSENAREVASLF